MRKYVAFAILLLLLVSGCGGGATSDRAAPAPDNTAPVEETGDSTGASGGATAASGLPVETVVINASGGEEVEVRAEIADDDAERQRGLMNRPEGSLPEDAGMLFVFPQEEYLSFWMKDTLIPLSIAYAAADGRIVDIQDMRPLDMTSHPSAEPSQYALEVNQGFFNERGVEIGDRLEIPESLS